MNINEGEHRILFIMFIFNMNSCHVTVMWGGGGIGHNQKNTLFSAFYKYISEPENEFAP